tara:strand:+ start:68 stop:670 length:603 start_codon:yes stop_codon:yes gene_type:complete
VSRALDAPSKTAIKVQKVEKPVPVFTTTVPNFRRVNQELKEYIERHRHKYVGTKMTNLKCDWRSSFLMHYECPEPIIKELITFSLDVSNTLSSYYQKDLSVPMYVDNFWIAEYEKGNSARKHGHYPADWAAVYYIEVEENASPLCFEDRLDVHPEEGMLVMFPGSLEHRVKPTMGRRVCAAMNLFKLPKLPINNSNAVDS